jgi:hypothetical protein
VQDELHSKEEQRVVNDLHCKEAQTLVDQVPPEKTERDNPSSEDVEPPTIALAQAREVLAHESADILETALTVLVRCVIAGVYATTVLTWVLGGISEALTWVIDLVLVLL